jgi:hypothetical protein
MRVRSPIARAKECALASRVALLDFAEEPVPIEIPSASVAMSAEKKRLFTTAA